MKYFSFLILALVALCAPSFSYAKDEVKWQTNFNQALEQSQSNHKPIVLFFTGSDWCSWCSKLDHEVFETPEFNQATKDKFIFVKLDFPRKQKLDPALAAQNKQLQDKYHIKGYPSLVVIDSNQKVLGTTGYRAGGGKAYADHLLSFIK